MPKGARLDNGGTYKPTKLQNKVWNFWNNYWKWVIQATKGETFSLLINGDIIDGHHHNSTHQWSHNLEDQCDHAYYILAPVCDLACETFIVRGTPVHSGESGVDEERLAKRLGAVPTNEGQYSRNEIWLKMGDHIIHAAHHIGTTASSAHETSAVNAELTAMFTESGRWGHEPPSVIVRSHRHRCSEIRLPSQKGYATAFVTAAWQLKTPFAYKIAGARVTTPQIGGSLIRLGDEELHTRHKVWDIGRSRLE
jgi:hypothetical protein